MAGPRDYGSGTRAALAMLSRGRCYYPGCPASILRFVDDEPYIDYQIAHIRDAKPGNRYVEGMTDEQRRSFGNLILLCKPHHELVDTRHPDRFAIDDLERWKTSREGAARADLNTIGPVTEESLGLLLQQSIADSQERVTDTLRAQDAAARERVERVRSDFSYAAVRDALAAVDQVNLLSGHGVRADMWLTDFYLRLRPIDGCIRVHLDTLQEASVFATDWLPDEQISDAFLRLAVAVRPTSWWPGAERFEFATALNTIVDTLVMGLQVKADGGWIRNAVQKIGDSWLLSDWEALEIRHQYQVLYRRLDEIDWYYHLAGKGWTDRGEVSDVLEHAAFLRSLAADDGAQTETPD